MSDLLIKGGLVIDGTGAPGRQADVRIHGGRIREIAPALAAAGERVIDAAGAVVAPGFIDSHTHYDATVYWDPTLDPITQHGVTTVLAGNCSLGLAPMRPADRKSQIDTFSYVEDLPIDLLNSVIPWEWEDYSQYAGSFKQRPLGLNLATLVGHSQLRAYVMGDAAWERAATAREIALIVDSLEDALRVGARGMSFSLFDKDRQGRPVPSRLADDAEIGALCAKLAEYEGLLQFVPGLSTEEVLCDLERLGALLAAHNVTGLFNGLGHVDAEPDRSSRIITCLEGLQAKGARIWAMVSPRPFEVRVDLDQSICFINLPSWNELVQASRDDKRRLASDAGWRARARSDAQSSYSPMFPFERPEHIRIASVGTPQLSKWVGRSLGDVAMSRGGDISDVLADWVLENNFDTSFVVPVANSDPSDVARLLQSRVAFISGSDAGAHLQMLCGAGDSTLLLTRYVRERGDLSLAEAIHALTGRQAKLLGLTDRGILAPDKAADITIFALEELEFGSERVANDLPEGGSRFTRDPGGFRYTIVNGVIVQDHGKPTSDLPGTWIGRQA